MRRFLIITLLVGVAGGAGYGTFAAFADTTSRPSNSFAGGTVTLGSNSAATPIYALTSRSPGDIGQRCVKVSYTGSLAASVRLYRGGLSGGNGLDSYVDLNVVRGAGDQPDCSDFTPAATIYSATLAAFPSTYAGGLALTNAAASASWAQGDAVTYRVTAQLQDDLRAQGLATGTHGFTWEARNQ